MRTATRISARLAAVALVACAGSEAGPRIPPKAEIHDDPYNILLIVLDTVRADHLSCYGYERETTPNIDAVARHGVLFPNAMSTAPWTLPSHASMFTGLAPHDHGAHTFRVETRENNVAPLPEDVPLLAEALRDLGYETAGFSANNVFMTPRWGLHRGFETYLADHAHAPVHNRKVFRWLDEKAREPFFLFVNYIDAHRPYNVRPRPGLLPRRPDRNAYLIDRLKRQVMGGDGPIPEDLRQRVIDQYDTAIAHIDEGVGALLLELDRRGLRENTVIVITSDHGEYFGEHRLVEHNMDVYQPGVHVPLIVDAPGEEPGVDETPVTSQDLAYLLADRIPTKRVREVLLEFSRGPGTHPVLVENYYSRLWDVFSDQWGHRFQAVRRGLYEWPYKLRHSSDGEHELYDLEEDPHELRDLCDLEPELVRRMAADVEEDVTDERAGQPATALTDLEIEQMRALGYME